MKKQSRKYFNIYLAALQLFQNLIHHFRNQFLQ